MVTRADAHKPDFHRDQVWKHPVRVATTADITIATALNAGDTIDGVTLAAGDRVLVWVQSTGSQNGIYDVAATPVRSYDMDSGLEAVGSFVRVLEGTTHGGKFFVNTNTGAVTIGTTALTFAESGSGAPTGADYLVGTAQAGLSAEIVVGTTPGGELGNTWASPTVDTTHAGSNHNQPVRKNSTGTVFERRRLNLIEGTNVTLTVADDAGNDEVDITIAATGGGSGITVQDEGTPLTTDATTLNFTGSGVTASGSGATKTINIPGGGGTALPALVQEPAVSVFSSGTTAIGLVYASAPTNGNRCYILVCSNSRGASSITQTNVTWTNLFTGNDGTRWTELWVGVVAASAGTTATVNFASSTRMQALGIEMTNVFTTAAANTAATSNQVGPLSTSSGDYVFVIATHTSSGGAVLIPNVQHIPIGATGGQGAGALLISPGGSIYAQRSTDVNSRMVLVKVT